MQIDIKAAWIRQTILLLVVLTLGACNSPGLDDQQLVQTAREYLDRQKLREAAIELRNALQENPENAEARYLLGMISVDVGDLGAAEKEFRRAGKAGWNAEQTQIGLARTLIASNEFKAVIDNIQAKEAYSSTARANIYGLQAIAQLGLEEVGQAREMVAIAAAIDANAFQVFSATIQIQLVSNKPESAAKTLEQAFSIYPEDPDLMLLSAFTAEQQNDHTAARDAYQKVIDRDPEKIITLNGRKARLGLARLEIEDKNPGQALTVLTPLFRRNGNDPESNYLGGMLAFEQGDLDLAEQRLFKVLKLVPDHSETQLLLGTVNYAQHNYEQAAYYISKYVSAVPENIGARKLLGRTYMMFGQYDEAHAALQQALDTVPEDADLLALVGLSQFQAGNTVSGIEGLENAVKAAPDNTVLREELAKAYISTGDAERAIQELKSLLSKQGKSGQMETLLVLAHLRAGQTDRAINAVLEILSANPADPVVLTLAGNVFAASNDRQEAREYLGKALQIKPGYVPATMSLARIEELEGDPVKAADLYKSSVHVDTESIEPLLALALLAEKQGNPEEAPAWLEKARERALHDTQPRVMLAQYYLNRNQPEKAEELIREAVKIAPWQPVLLGLQGRALMAKQRYNDALSSLKEYVAREPESVVAHDLLGETYLELGQLMDARKHLKIALSKQARYVPTLVLLARVELQSDQNELALEYANQIQRVQPKLFMGYELAGDAWMQMNDYAEAGTAFAQARDRKPSSELAIKLSEAASRTGQHEEAVSILRVWLADHADDVRAQLFLGATYLNMGQTDKAIRQYEKVLEMEPDNAGALNNLAWLFMLTRDPRALALAEKAYYVTPDDPEIQDTYGWALVQQGKVDKGRRLLSQAAEQLPDKAEIMYHYAVALLKSGRQQEGRRVLISLLKEGQPFEGRDEAKALLRE